MIFSFSSHKFTIDPKPEVDIYRIMANTAAARKDIRQSKKRTSRNNVKRRNYREAMKAAVAAIKAGDKKAQELVNVAHKMLDKAAKSNVIHKNKAARLKGRLQKQLNKSAK